MSHRVHLTHSSSNSKTGPIPVSTTSADSCPPSCPLKKAGCYANGGPLAIHWREVTEGRRGTDWGTFCAKIAALPEGTFYVSTFVPRAGHDSSVLRLTVCQAQIPMTLPWRSLARPTY